MCTPTDKAPAAAAPAPAPSGGLGAVATGLLAAVAVCTIIAVAELGVLVSNTSGLTTPQVIVNGGGGGGTTTTGEMSDKPYDEMSAPEGGSDKVPDSMGPALGGVNTCAGKKLEFPNVECVVNGMTQVGPQAGANVTKGYNGGMEVDESVQPITEPYYQKGLCPVNVHWHLGAEHLSVGEYDENGSGPFVQYVDGGIRPGHQCNAYDPEDPKFTKEYDWKYCELMEVGQTYEVHWPHSAVGACGTPNQYQTPFYDGVFCNLDMETFSTLEPAQIAGAVGVQAQVFIVVNDESYFWPDLMRGMIVDGEYGMDIAKYTGSTTGDSRNNEICSQYSPITWQVDRKCHMISASAFDKLCYDMLQQRDDMSGDVYPHGSRPTVAHDLAANNYENGGNRFLRY